MCDPNETPVHESHELISDVRQCEANKAYAVGEYVKGLGLSISEMMRRGDHSEYPWNSGSKNNPNRKEMLEAIHEKAMEAINSIA